jgi:mevalonate kinase
MDKRTFNSKVLLFGEYSIIKDSMALSIPYDKFGGSLSFKYDKSIDPELRDLSKYLKSMFARSEYEMSFDIDSFEFDVGRGLFFDSSIPQGYGLGSSGALVAAIYSNYFKSSKGNLSISEMKNIFAQMENYFHGASSGVDPLISYEEAPMLINGKGPDVCSVTIPDYSSGDGAIFLLNTGRPRRTEPLVNLFLEKCKGEEFDRLCQKVLLPITNGCITSFMEGNVSSLFEFFRQLSDFQYRHFTPMIPTLYQDLWKEGIDDGLFYLKLCGAGGGGFILGMTKDFEQTTQLLGHYEIRPLLKVRPN